MRTAIVTAVIVFAGCGEEHRSITLRLGPDDQTISQGFKCLEEVGATALAARGYTATGPNRGDFVANLVVDFIVLDGVPSCRGEEILAWCGDHACEPAIEQVRFCARVELLDMTLDEIINNTRLPEIYADLRDAGPITTDAPDGPVIVRAVATTQSCAQLQAVGGVYPAFDRTALIGCAYSCPLLLDEVDGDVQLSFDAIGICRLPEVEICAGDLNP
jgi:hypothetical protein